MSHRHSRHELDFIFPFYQDSEGWWWVDNNLVSHGPYRTQDEAEGASERHEQ